MNKKMFIPIIVCFVIVVGIIGFVLWNNRTTSTITLDINPSVEINLNRFERVKIIKALNDDAKEIVDNNIKGKSLEESLDIITDNLIKKGYAREEELLEVILYTNGNISNKQIEEKLAKTFREKRIESEYIIIDKITNEDKELAKKYNISPAKVSYIKTIAKENENVSFENLASKPTNELKETKETGNYCEEGYALEGDWCYKEIGRKSASSGEICPRGYYEYEDKCYEEIPSEETNNLVCHDDFELKDNKCVRNQSIDAEPSKYTCSKGEAKTRYELGLSGQNDGDANDVVCIDLSNAKHPVSPCETHDGTEYTVSGGKCYWHRAPVIESGCPGKIRIGNMCWDDASNVLICEGYRDGKRYSSRNEYCEHSIKYIKPTITEYKCPSDYNLDGNKCLKYEIEDAEHERACPSGYTLVNHDRCINKDATANKEAGFICDMPNSRLKDKACIIYDVIEAKH